MNLEDGVGKTCFVRREVRSVLSITLFVKPCRGILVRLDIQRVIPLPFQYSMIMVCTSFESMVERTRTATSMLEISILG